MSDVQGVGRHVVLRGLPDGDIIESDMLLKSAMGICQWRHSSNREESSNSCGRSIGEFASAL